MTTTFASHFVTKTRNPVTKTSTDSGGEPFTTLADDRPDWLQEAVREAHQGTLPSDWIYAECKAAAEAFDEGVFDDCEDDDSVHEYVDGRVDVYTQALYRWAADFCLTETFSVADEEASDMDDPEMSACEVDLAKRLSNIQYAAIRHIADTMREACIAAAKSTETESVTE